MTMQEIVDAQAHLNRMTAAFRAQQEREHSRQSPSEGGEGGGGRVTMLDWEEASAAREPPRNPITLVIKR